jgi:hypothetical protein
MLHAKAHKHIKHQNLLALSGKNVSKKVKYTYQEQPHPEDSSSPAQKIEREREHR